jgi:L-rhamnose mutarotase
MIRLFIAVFFSSAMLLCASCNLKLDNDMQTSKETSTISAQETDRYCLALDLKPDSKLMKEYQGLHSPDGMWPEIPVGIRKSGCLDMEIYIIDNHMFMIVDIPKGADLDEIWEKMGTFERQAEWGEFMLKFQQAIEGHGDEVKWVLMKKVYDLDDYN